MPDFERTWLLFSPWGEPTTSDHSETSNEATADTIVQYLIVWPETCRSAKDCFWKCKLHKVTLSRVLPTGYAMWWLSSRRLETSNRGNHSMRVESRRILDRGPVWFSNDGQIPSRLTPVTFGTWLILLEALCYNTYARSMKEPLEFQLYMNEGLGLRKITMTCFIIHMARQHDSGEVKG